MTKPKNTKSVLKSPWLAIAIIVLIGFATYRFFNSSQSKDYAGVPKRAVEYYKEGSAHLEKGDIENALSAFLKAIDVDATFASANARAGEAYFRAALAHKKNNNTNMMNAMLEQARTFGQQALRYDPNNGFGHLVIGLLHFENNNLDSALIEMEAAGQNGVSTFDFHSMLGFLYNQKAETAKCIEQYEAAARIKPDDVKTLYNLGELYYGIGSYSKAAEYFSRVIKSETDDQNARACYAASLWKGGKEDQAKDLLNGMLKEGSNKFQSYNTVAWVLIDKDVDVEWGLKLAKAAYDMKPRNIGSVDILGWGYYKAGDYPNAVNYLNMSMRMRPSEEVKRRLQMAKDKLESQK